MDVPRWLLGKPKDLRDRGVFQHLSLVAFFGWVGLGADGLSSSAYGPEEAFRQLIGHEYLAIALALAMALTVWVLCASYARIIELFPSGGGGYAVASKLLGPQAGVISGSALLVDYVLTIAISVSAGANAVFAFLPAEWEPFKFSAVIGVVLLLMVMNLRGVKESIFVLTPIFLVFVVTHATLLAGVIGAHVGEVEEVARHVGTSASSDLGTLGLGGLALLFARAYALGGGTYTGIEAVANGVGIMREPRTQTARHTLTLTGVSLALTAGGIIVCYLLLDLHPSETEPMNAVLAKRFASETGIGNAFVILCLLSEGALLFVAAQSGFVAGPTVMANMATDSWLPHQLAALSEQLTIRNGIYLMGGAALLTLFYTRGDVHQLVVMYSINVFLGFTLSNLAMSRHEAAQASYQWSALGIHLLAFVLCAAVLVLTSVEKFSAGGWVTLLVTGGVIALAHRIRSHYRSVGELIQKLNLKLNVELAAEMPALGEEASAPQPAVEMDPEKPTAVVLVGGYSGLGIQTVLEIERVFPGQYHQIVFISAGIVDSGAFKGAGEVDALREKLGRDLERYVEFARRRFGWAADRDVAIGTDAVFELERLCRQVYLRFPLSVFFAGQLVVRQPTWWYRLLHNETAFAVQRRLQFDRLPMVILPTRVH
jgi:amino acid transporter